MKNIVHLAAKAWKIGIGNTIRGFMIKSRYSALREEYGFDPWHVAPLELRRYAVGMSRLLERRIRSGDVVVDVGCGLGDLLRTLSDRASARADYYGFDLSAEAIAAAKHINRQRNIRFACGSFAEIKNHIDGPIDWLVAVNFFHVTNPEAIKGYIQELLSTSPVRHIVVDVVPANGIKHDFSKLLPPEYQLEYTSEPYEGGRLIQIFSDKKNDDADSVGS
ncbi:MAG: methyltransferase domain-containing protein [Clostridiales Family XIII bacterium]|jgi:SAM-dependent methyltransferase|nr:methyltransferase domain-containing protein [Clostridiales Family XIII bacterium]